MANGHQGALEPSGETKSALGATVEPCLTGMDELVAKLYATSGSSQFGISLQDFTRILNEVVEKYCVRSGDTKDYRELLFSLRVGELALARGCAAGNEKAWETLLTRYREPLYEMATQIARDEAVGRELADSLYGELYGITTRGEKCSSKLNSYTGIGSLAGWLRTVLAQSFIDRYRREQRLTSLDENEDEGHAPLPQTVQQPVEPETLPDPRLNEVTDAALLAMDSEDRFLIASYYLDHQTLADIASTLNVHESTISRRLEKITVKLRKAIRVGLLKRGMSQEEVEQALLTDVRDLQVNVAGRLKENTQETRSGSFFK
jgi:RNA polymerase sigma-70 factor (ECF subfamily)